MIFGNLDNALSGDQSIIETINENYKASLLNIKKPTKWSKILTTLSHYGMSYDDKIYKNIQAIPADKLLQDKDEANLLQQNLYGTWQNNWKIKPEEEKTFTEKTFDQKRIVLRNMAMQPELENILDQMANESIVYDDEEAYICQPFLDKGLIHDLNEQNAAEIDKIIQTSFYKIYLLLNWKTNAWDEYRKYLIEGVLCYEIVYDNLENPKSIINIVPLDPATLTKVVEDMTVYWVQFKGIHGRERKLLDSQIIYVKYDDSGVSTRQSYLERLIRPFNLYRIVEQAQVIWTVTQSSFKTLFTIPIGSMNRAKGMQTLAAAMNRYKEDISFNVDTGELMVNGKPNLPFNKEYWLPQNESGRPEIETLVDNGPQLNDSDQIKWFETKLYKMSKIPINRFDREAGTTWFGTDPTQALREEIDFARFIIRLRNNFAQIMLKPLRIQLALLFPDIKNDKRILNSVSLRWNSYNLFEEMMNIEVMSKRIEFIANMKDSLTEVDSEGNDVPYFSMKFLIQKYLKMSEADLDLNDKLKLEEKLKGKSGEEGAEDEESSDETEETGDEGGGDEAGLEPENGGIDDEMMGDVQPESSETTEA